MPSICINLDENSIVRAEYNSLMGNKTLSMRADLH